MQKICTILNTPVDAYSLEEVLEHVHHFVDSAKPHHIVTVNTEFVMEARSNAAFAKALVSADLHLADGAGILLAAKLLNQPSLHRIPGVDFVQILANLAAQQGYSLFLLGGRDGVGQKAADVLESLNPGLEIAGTYEGAPDEEGIVERIKKAKPDILLVAWGAPKQDIWISKHKHQLGVPVMMGVGGTFDVLAGKQKRAPEWMRAMGLEWLWRLLREPWRWHRQLALPQMFLLILWYKLTGFPVK